MVSYNKGIGRVRRAMPTSLTMPFKKSESLQTSSYFLSSHGVQRTSNKPVPRIQRYWRRTYNSISPFYSRRAASVTGSSFSIGDWHLLENIYVAEETVVELYWWGVGGDRTGYIEPGIRTSGWGEGAVEYYLEVVTTYAFVSYVLKRVRGNGSGSCFGMGRFVFHSMEVLEWWNGDSFVAYIVGFVG